MNVEINDIVIILEETSGGVWIKNTVGDRGWILLENLEKKRIVNRTKKSKTNKQSSLKR